MDNKQIIEFIGDECRTDEAGYIWGTSTAGGQMIAEVRGWGAIQNLFKNKDGSVDFDKAEAFQDKLSQFIADAVTEKIQREKCF